MRLPTGVKPKIKFYVLTALIFTITFIQLIPSRRPKTILIYNNEYLCSTNQLSSTKNNQKSIVIVVLSHRKNFVQRNLIRNTWGSIRKVNNIKILSVVFMLGSQDGPGEPQTDRSQLETERVQFGDLVMGDFVENYRNLTLKSIMAYEWLTTFCLEAQIVVKTDDDVVLNIFKLTKELDAWTPTEMASSHMWCAVHWLETVLRDNTQYHVTVEEYAGDVFPKHCAGVGYVTPIGVIKRIMDEISRSYLGIVCTHEDVFMTGIVPQKINSKNSSLNDPITHIDKIVDWVTYALQDGAKVNDKFLIDLVERPKNETENYDEFLKLFGTQIFYLLNHGPDFESKYQKLWYIIEQSSQSDNAN